MARRRPRPASLTFLLTAVGATFLHGCSCDEDRPYTPFQVATALPTDPSAPDPESTTPAPPSEKTRTLQSVTGRPESWQVFGRDLRAPEGTGFVAGVEDSQPSGTNIIAAWVLPRKGGELGGQSGLWLFDDGGLPSRRLILPPAHLPSGKDCEHSIELVDSGGKSFSSFLRARCSSRLLPGIATGALLVVDPTAEVPERLSFRLREPAPGEDLTLEPRSDDTDGDGQDDFSLEVRLKAPSGETETLTFQWVGRASGLSHVSASPREELLRRAGRLAIAAVRKKEREQALDQIDALRRLLFASCAESKTERITDGAGVGLRCGDLGAVSERLTGAAIQAFVGLKTPWRALGEFERNGYYFGGPTGSAETEQRRTLEKVIQRVPARVVEQAQLSIGMDLPYPTASPLRFDAVGRLWTLSASGRVRRVGGNEPEPEVPGPPPPSPLPAEGEGNQAEGDQAAEARLEALAPSAPPEVPAPPPWPLRPTSAKGEMLSAAVPSCERSEVQLAFSGERGGVLPSRPLPFLAPRPGGCRTLTGTPIPAEVVSWDSGTLLAIVAGEPVVTAGHLSAPTAPLAWGTALGIAVWSKSEFFLLTGEETSGAHHCSLSPGGKQVACVRGQSVVVYEAAGP